MKKLTLAIILMSSVVATITSCNKNAESNRQKEPGTTKSANAAAKGFLSWLAGFFSGGSVELDVCFRHGFFTFTKTTTPEGGSSETEECHPADAVCVLSVIIRGKGVTTRDLQPEGYSSATAGVTNDGHLRLVVPRSSMTDKTYAEHYADGIASVPGLWKVQEEITAGLGLPSDFTVQPGNYPVESVEHDGAQYIIVTY